MVKVCYNPNNIIGQCPYLWTNLVDESVIYPSAPAIYFDRDDVKKAMHVRAVSIPATTFAIF